MSRAPHETINVPDGGFGLGDDQYQPRSAHNRPPYGLSNFVDGSGPILSMYLEMAAEEDKKMAESWKADADGILIFTGLFSAAVASLISVSIQDIRPNPQDTSNFHLANIYQAIADPTSNRPNISHHSPPTFSPPNHAVWVNSLWFMSFVISLTCALLATLLQQWARRYIKVTQPRYTPHKRARIRAFFFEGVDKFLLPWAVKVLPTLLHASLFLFFAGLVVFLCNVNLTIFKLVLSWVSICAVLYGCITIMPIFYHDSPYYTPLTSLAWPLVVGMSYAIFRVLLWFTWSVNTLKERYYKIILQGVLKTLEETALNSPPEIDIRAFLWTFDTLDEDHELERFFAGLPGFRSSKVVNDPLPCLTQEQNKKLSTALMRLLNATFLSDLLPEPIKKRRAIICAKAIDPIHTPWAPIILDRILSSCQHSGPVAADIVQIVRGWGNNKDEDAASLAGAAISSVVARAQQRDNPWFVLASNELGVPEAVIRNYAAHGDNLSLAILIHITRQQFSHFRKGSWPEFEFSKVLEATSKFDVQDTSFELQHEFCALWNQIVLKAQRDDDRWMPLQILGPIRNIYIALHQDTLSAPTQFSTSTNNWDDTLRVPSSYPLCSVAGHICCDVVSATSAAALPPTSPASSDAHHSSVLAPVHVVESLTGVPPLDNFYRDPAHQTTIESVRIHVSSLDPATSNTTMPQLAPQASPSTPLSFTSPPVSVVLQHNPGLLAPSDTPNLSSVAASNPVLDNILPTELHGSMTAITAPSAAPGPTSAPCLGAATQDDGSPKPVSRKGMDALGPPL